MTLSKAEVKTLIEIYSGKKSISEISKALQVGFSQVSTVVSSLENKQLCSKVRQGKHVKIRMTNTPVAVAFRRLIVQDKPFKLDKFLYGIKFRILSSCLYESKTTKDIAQMLNVSRKSVQNVLYPFINRLILKREKRALLFQQKAWPFLYDFLDAYRTFSLKGDILWKFEDEMVFEVREKNEIKGTMTGFNAYENYDVPIRCVKYCCYLPHRKLTKTKIFIHSVLQIEDTRQLELAIVFFKKNGLSAREICNIAVKYDLKKKVDDFILVLKSKEEKIQTDTLPSTSKTGIHDMMKLYREI